MQSSMSRSYRVLWFALLAVLLSGTPVRAEDRIWVTGHVTSPDGSPMAGAVVAVYDDSNHVVDYARTDSRGDYTLAVPRKTLHLDKHTPGFFTEIVGGIERFVGGAAEFIANPLRAGVHAAGSAVSVTDPLMRGEIAAGTSVADRLLFAPTPHAKAPVRQEERKMPGVLVMKVVANGSSDLVSVVSVYWMEEEVLKAGGKETRAMAAWLDPVQLADADSEGRSKVDSNYLRFTSARLEPSIAQPGQHVHIFARMPLPNDPPVYVNVVARNNRTGQKYELTSLGDGRFEGEFVVDKHFPHDDQAISLLAYAAQPQHPGRRPQVERALEGAGLWDAQKPFLYNPLVVVSRNRADMILTVVKAEKRRH